VRLVSKRLKQLRSRTVTSRKGNQARKKHKVSADKGLKMLAAQKSQRGGGRRRSEPEIRVNALPSEERHDRNSGRCSNHAEDWWEKKKKRGEFQGQGLRKRLRCKRSDRRRGSTKSKGGKKFGGDRECLRMPPTGD